MEFMLIRARAWWYLHFVRPENWPPDVREYIIRSSLRMMGDGTGLKPEQQLELAVREIAALWSDDLSPEIVQELWSDGLRRLARVPHETCAICGRPVPTHIAQKADGKFYHESCATQRAESGKK